MGTSMVSGEDFPIFPWKPIHWYLVVRTPGSRCSQPSESWKMLESWTKWLTFKHGQTEYFPRFFLGPQNLLTNWGYNHQVGFGGIPLRKVMASFQFGNDHIAPMTSWSFEVRYTDYSPNAIIRSKKNPWLTSWFVLAGSSQSRQRCSGQDFSGVISINSCCIPAWEMGWWSPIAHIDSYV